MTTLANIFAHLQHLRKTRDRSFCVVQDEFAKAQNEISGASARYGRRRTSIIIYRYSGTLGLGVKILEIIQNSD
jgi:hypothetical protein